MNIIEKIVESTKDVISHDRMKKPLDELKGRCRDMPHPIPFSPAFRKEGVNIIAEVKKASPSAGVLCTLFDPVKIAKEYEEGGAAAISVLTEPTKFLGSIHALEQIRTTVSLPLLRKDFIFDPYQIYQAKTSGADAFLLIYTILEKNQAEDLLLLGKELGLEALIEVHNEDELDSVLSIGAGLIGINNRNLKTFEVNISTTKELAPKVPKKSVVISESGINSHEQIIELRKVGVSGVLIGEALMRSTDRCAKLKELIHGKS